LRQAYDYWQNQPGSCRAPGRPEGRPSLRRPPTRGRGGEELATVCQAPHRELRRPGTRGASGKVAATPSACHPASDPRAHQGRFSRAVAQVPLEGRAPRDLATHEGGPGSGSGAWPPAPSGWSPAARNRRGQRPAVHRAHRAAAGTAKSPPPECFAVACVALGLCTPQRWRE